MNKNTENTGTKNTIKYIIAGERYERLAKVAEAMNSCSWCDSDNTAESVFRNFVVTWVENMLDDTTTLCDSILDGIATDGEYGRAPQPLEVERIAELRRAFDAITTQADGDEP